MKAGKVLLLITVLCLGAGLQTALAVRDRISIGAAGCRVLGGRFEGPSHAFEAQAAVDVPPGTRLRVDNAFGAVKVRAGQAGQAQVSLRKVVFLPQEARARQVADKLRLSAVLAGDELHVTTNREEFEHGEFEDVGLETHIDIVVPPGTPVSVANAHGAVEAVDVASASIDASFDAVRLERVAGAADVKSRHGDVSVVGVGGALSLENRHGDVEVRDAASSVGLNVEHGDVTLLGAGPVEARLRHSDLKAERVGGGLHVRGEHAGVEAGPVSGAADIETSFRDVTLRQVGGGVRVVSKHADVEVEDAGAEVVARVESGGVTLARVKGATDIEIEHGGLDARALEGGARVSAGGEAVKLDGFRGAVDVRARHSDVSLVPSGPLADAVLVNVENGSLTLAVPGGSRVQVDAEAERGDIALVDVPGLSATGGDPSRASGVLGGGGASVTLRTRHADIRIEGRNAVASDARER